MYLHAFQCMCTTCMCVLQCIHHNTHTHHTNANANSIAATRWSRTPGKARRLQPVRLDPALSIHFIYIEIILLCSLDNHSYSAPFKSNKPEPIQDLLHDSMYGGQCVPHSVYTMPTYQHNLAVYTHYLSHQEQCDKLHYSAKSACGKLTRGEITTRTGSHGVGSCSYYTLKILTLYGFIPSVHSRR